MIKEFTRSYIYSKRMALSFKITLLLILTSSCGQYQDIFNNNKLHFTHEIIRNEIKQVIDYFLFQDDNFKEWTNYKSKLILMSISTKNDNEGKKLIRAIPLLKEKFALPYLKNDYDGYFEYKGVTVVFWTDDYSFFKKNKSSKKRLFNKKSLNIIKSPEYFGCTFNIKKDKLIFLEKTYYFEHVLPKFQ